jgi:hypothetical protein
MRLTAFGRRLLAARLGGVAVRALATGGTPEGGALAARAPTRAVVTPETFTTPAGAWVPGRAALTARGRVFVRGLRGKLVAVKGATCRGYAATLGGTTALELSRRRAAVMCGALHALGVRAPKTRIGYGKLDPVATNATESGRRHNRRVQVTLNH